LEALRPLLQRALSDAVQLMAGQRRTRVHGDLHLGQMLVAGNDVAIIDFEGEPLKTLEERRAKHLPLRDVAGMLRSFDYAAAQIERSAKQASAEGKARAAAVLSQFRSAAAQAFLTGYETGRGEKLSADEHSLLQFLVLEKAAYEVTYEAANRPSWIGVPLQGVLQILEQLGIKPHTQGLRQTGAQEPADA
jgi:maltose alpha-D-glucosyltransferase/alpha-amylase